MVDADTQEALGGPVGDTLRKYTTSHLVGRLGYPEEIAAVVVYLASDDACSSRSSTSSGTASWVASRPSR